MELFKLVEDMGMSAPIFVYGTLRDEDVLSLALGEARARVTALPAQLPGHVALRAAAGPFPALRPARGQAAPGLLLQPGDADIRARLDFFEGAFDYALVPASVETGQGVAEALVYAPPPGLADTGERWDLARWQREDKPLMMEMAREVMDRHLDGQARAEQRTGILRRALARLHAAAEPAPADLRGDPGPGAVTGHRVRRIHTGFFALEEHSYRHRLFDGGTSREVLREVFVTGDAVCVLPWDPRTDRVLLIEQVRAGLIARGDPNPWNLEVIAGMCDRPEPPEETARREALEEAGLALGRLERVAGFYPTPGGVTEFVTSFIGEADLSEHVEGLHGLDSETEDIRTLIIPRARAMAALARGEARNAPLVISLMALERERARLAALWSE